MLTIRLLGGTSQFGRPLKTKDQEIEHETVVLEHEGRELQTSDKTVTIDVRHVLEREGRVVFGRDVVGQVVVEDQSEQSVQEGQVDLLVHPRQNRFHHDDAFAIARLPHVGQVVDTLAPLVHQQGRGLRVGRLDPAIVSSASPR